MTWTRRSRLSRSTSSREAFALLQLALQAIGAALDDLLLLAQLEQVARAGEKLVMIDRALQEVRGAGLERADSELRSS